MISPPACWRPATSPPHPLIVPAGPPPKAGSGCRRAVVNLGIAPENTVAETLARTLSLPLVEADEWPTEAVGDASTRWMEQARLLPLRLEDDHVVVAAADPTDTAALHAASLLFDLPVQVRVATQSDIRKAVAKLHDGSASDAHFTTSAADDDLQRLKDLASEAPVVRFVNRMIIQAVENRASDIHLESHDAGPLLWLRIDGDLSPIEPPATALHRAVVSRIKILAGLDIAERRLPQDGRIQMTVGGRQIDLRVATVPTLHGESVVLRVLDRGSVELDFGKLGFTGPVLDKWIEAANRPHGIVLVTGPTGSGKTTTLYSSLLRIHDPARKYFTIEDPIEYQLAGINQTQVKPGIGLTFASILRALLRQDPNVILVGEIRDRETAQTAIEASLTGHLIMSTLHTNDSAGAITRLLEMGVEDYLLASTINAILAQRLVRTLCPDCREPHPYADALIERFDLHRLATSGTPTPHACAGLPKLPGQRLARPDHDHRTAGHDRPHARRRDGARRNRQAGRTGEIRRHGNPVRERHAQSRRWRHHRRGDPAGDAPGRRLMPIFEFEAVERDGKVAIGTLSAADSDAVARQLQERGAVPLRIETGQSAAFGIASLRRSLPSAKLSRFARELALLLDAGLRLDQALTSVARSRDLRPLAPALNVVLEEVRAGVPFSDALERRPEIAPPYAIGMIRAGEAAGALATILRSLADLADRRARSAKAVRAALTYPAILAVTAGVSIATLFTVVLPQLEPLFEGAGDRLPTMTIIVLAASRLFREYGLFALGALILAGLAIRMSLNTPETRRALPRPPPAHCPSSAA